MANYATLKTAIQSVIKQNGNNEITGPLLQQSLLAMINSLGSGYQFVDVAQESTNPGTPDEKVFYVALPGTYANFGGTIVPIGSVGIFMYSTTWTYLVVDVASPEKYALIGDLENSYPFSVNFNGGYGLIDGGFIQTGHDGYYRIKFKMPDTLQSNAIALDFGSNNDWYIKLANERLNFSYIDANNDRRNVVLSYDYTDYLGKDVDVTIQKDSTYLNVYFNGSLLTPVSSWKEPTGSGYGIAGLYGGSLPCPMRFYYLDVFDKTTGSRNLYSAQNVEYYGGTPTIYVANLAIPNNSKISEIEQLAKNVPFLRMNGINSVLLYSNRQSLVLTAGSVEMKLRLPNNVQNNQMLFAFSNVFICNVNGGTINVYNQGSKALVNVTALAGKIITLRIEKSLNGTTATFKTFIDGVLMSTESMTQTATQDSTDLSIGSYDAGGGLFCPLDFFYFIKYDAMGVVQYVITPETIADVNFANELYIGNVNLSEQGQSANLDALPSTLYLTAGKQYNVYMDNVVFGFTELGMTVCVSGSGVKTIEAQNRNVRLNIATAGNYSTVWNLYDAGGVLVASKSIALKVVAPTAGSGTKQFLFVGDSTIDNAISAAHNGPEIVKEFYALCGANAGFTPLLLGKQTYSEDGITYRHEGHAGWSSGMFLGSSSPFYYNGQIDFAAYMADVYPLTPGAGNSIDFMVYQIGLNDLKTGGSVSSVIANIKTLITALFASFPNAKVIIGMPPTGCDATGWAAHFNGNVTTLAEYIPFRKRMMEYLKAIISEFDDAAYNANVFICNGGEMIDRVFGFPYEQLPVSARVSTTVMTHTDSMHPNKDGYDEIADGYFGRVKNLV